tara:strand:- start:230 stop:676 length:447 start_codon:yes stop_codon:yes gene_type:complete
MKSLIVGLLTIITLTCKKDYKSIISPDLQSYVSEYLSLLEDNNVKVKEQDFIVVFNSMMPSPRIAGYAYGMFKDDYVLVNINPRIWSTLNNSQKRTLIFHELSHDLFNILHSDDVFVMNPILHQPLESFLNNKKKSDKELIKYIKDAR